MTHAIVDLARSTKNATILTKYAHFLTLEDVNRWYNKYMPKTQNINTTTYKQSLKTSKEVYKFPVIIEKDEDGFYVVECPLFEGCYSQGKTVDEALRNIREVIELTIEEKKNREILLTT